MQEKVIVHHNPMLWLQEVIDATKEGWELSDNNYHSIDTYPCFRITLVKPLLNLSGDALDETSGAGVGEGSQKEENASEGVKTGNKRGRPAK